jgi:hypothetical protein
MSLVIERIPILPPGESAHLRIELVDMFIIIQSKGFWVLYIFYYLMFGSLYVIRMPRHSFRLLLLDQQLKPSVCKLDQQRLNSAAFMCQLWTVQSVDLLLLLL